MINVSATSELPPLPVSDTDSSTLVLTKVLLHVVALHAQTIDARNPTALVLASQALLHHSRRGT